MKQGGDVSSELQRKSVGKHRAQTGYRAALDTASDAIPGPGLHKLECSLQTHLSLSVSAAPWVGPGRVRGGLYHSCLCTLFSVDSIFTKKYHAHPDLGHTGHINYLKQGFQRDTIFPVYF